MLQKLRDNVFGWVAVASGVALVGVSAACGADQAEAPRAELRASDTLQCKGFEQLMPNFLKAISAGRTENLRKVVHDHLLEPDRPGDPPPINDVLRAVMGTLQGFATKPPEPGAAAGQLCAVPPPPIENANELCELRRTLETLIHQGKALEAVRIIDPQTTALLRYITGEGADKTPHYEVATVVGDLCSQDGVCQMSNGLDLIVALTTFARSPEGKAATERLDALSMKSSLLDFLKPESVTEDGFVALARTLLGAIIGGMPNDLDNLPLPPDLQQDLGPVIADLKMLIDPNHVPNIATPLKKTLNCFVSKDKNLDAVRMLYRLAIRDKLPEFGLTRLAQLLREVRAVDERGSLLYLAGTMAAAVKTDEQAIDSAAKVCRTVFSTQSTAVQSKSNAELALPVMADLFAHGVASEVVCAADTLLWGCAGGSQPACAP